MSMTGRAKLAGVIGWPVGHSKSPALHGYWLDKYGIDGAYVPLPVAPENFDRVVRALPDMGFQGANVTVPHKEDTLKLADEVTDAARRIGAVNTLVFKDGKIFGSNTDAFGFLENLKTGAPKWTPNAGPAVVIGAGGASRAVCAALIDAGVPELRLVNRTLARAETLAEDIGGNIEALDWDLRNDVLDGAALLVNTTSRGMDGGDPLDITLDPLPKNAVVTDIVYAPLITPLLQQALDKGFHTVDGLGMLLHQARPGFETWFGTRPEVDVALRDHILSLG